MRKRRILIFTYILFSVLPIFSQLESIEYQGEIDYFFGAGMQIPLFGTIYPGRGSEDILLGLQSNRIIDSLYITALADERFSALLDYDSERNDFLGSGNEYQLLYTGPEYNFVKKISLGNIEPLFPQNNIFPHYPGSNNGLSMFFAGNNRLFSIDALVRYDNTARMQKAFSGSSEIIESSQSDKSYVKRKYYFLPDSGIDAAELKLFQKKSEGDENLITSYSRLYPEKDYSFDSDKGWILLKSQLPSNTGLVVRYLINGNAAGDASLGINAIINSDGERKNFNKSTYPEYFRFIDEEEYLILHEEQLDSFWELKNAYYLPGSSGTSAEIKKAELINNLSGEENSSYQSILYNNFFYSADGVFFFIAEDETGFHPRPFPGNAPFINSTTGDNPYSIQNPVYSGISGNGIHSLNITVFSPVSNYFLSYGIIENSIEVVIGGRPVAGNLYSVDYDTGTISFTAGVLSASSLVVVSWNEGGETGTDEKLSGALSIGIDKGVQFGFHTKFELPVADRYQLTIEDQADSFLDLGLSTDYLIGSKENSYIEFNAAAGLRYPVPGITDARTISSFKGEYNYSVSVSEDNWQIAGTSSLLESLMPAVNLNTRGELLYTSYYEDTVVKGTILHSIYWDAPAEQHYAYSMQSGPYNTSDAFEGGNSRSLVLEYSFADGSDSPYINAVIPLKNIDLDFSDQLSIRYKTLEINGELPKLYIELLSTYQEDIDGDDLLDSELSTEEAGFMIVPTDGTQTFIGKSYDGGSNSNKDSEDLNRNGVLDPAGPFLTDTEDGLVL
ncbi:MAG TPA: hypothetical protein DCO79_09525, partial [Spirochaeta sp.]|nr:hypothetical protein [Spirochaeta sp.]